MPYRLIYPDEKDPVTGKTLVVTPEDEGSEPASGEGEGEGTVLARIPESFTVPVPGEPGQEIKIAVDPGTGGVHAVIEKEGA